MDFTVVVHGLEGCTHLHTGLNVTYKLIASIEWDDKLLAVDMCDSLLRTDYDSLRAFKNQFKDVLVPPGHYLTSVTLLLRLQYCT